MITIQRDFHGRPITIECGKLARQANGAVTIRYGDSIVLVTACAGDVKDGDFLPLTVDYQEKTYAAGKIPGGFFRREGKLSEREILVSRLIDRPCRPLFSEGYYHDTQVIATVISADEEVETDVLAVCGASAALTVSEMPFLGPIAAVRVGRVHGKLVINPSSSQRRIADMDFVVAGSKDAIVMVEGGAREVPEDQVQDALMYAHREMQVLIQMQEELRAKIGKPKMQVTPKAVDQALLKKVNELASPKMRQALRIKEKLARREALSAIGAELKEKFLPAGAENAEEIERQLNKFFEDISYREMREMVLSEKVRIDGRDNKTIRPITVDTGVLPRTHGSAIFTRGETQALVIATLGTSQEAQRMDTILGDENKTFMLHYNFPPFSTGETKPMRGPGRREIGHGALAERAIRYVMPTEQEFPYVVRVVSEVLESNGSSSMATTCGASLSLMDAGVPLKGQVAGIAMGLIKEGDRYAILSDILGDEDHLGDMDFKVAGTAKGVTAIQMDIKICGLDEKIMREALRQAHEGRVHILSKMDAVLSATRKEMSKYAPRIYTLKISNEKIRDVIGPGGKTIRSIQESCGVKVEVDDDGTVRVASTDSKKAEDAIRIIQNLTAEAEVGKLYQGIVKRIADFGAFVEILPGTDGLVHISQLADTRVNRVTDVVREGDQVWVKVIEVERGSGKIRLSLKEAIAEMREKGLTA